MSCIEIYQDCDWDGDGFNSPLPVFWAKGHDLDEREFRRAIFEYSLDEEVDLPAIGWEDDVKQMWQRNVELSGGGVEYERTTEPPKYPGSMQGQETFPITILDQYQQRRGQMKCAVLRCKEPWSVGSPARVRVSTDQTEVSVYLWLCREHRKAYPEPSYRVCMVPVGATILLPAPAEPAAPTHARPSPTT